MKMPGRPKTERRREEGEKPKGTKLSRKGLKIKCSACGGLNHNKRKCTGNPTAGVKEYGNYTRAAKRSKKKQDKDAGQGSRSTVHVEQLSTTAQQSQPATAHKAAKKKQDKEAGQGSASTVPHQLATEKRKKRKATIETSSQPARGVNNGYQPAPVTEPGVSLSQSVTASFQQNTNQQFDSSMTIPTEGRLEWWFYGNENKLRDT